MVDNTAVTPGESIRVFTRTGGGKFRGCYGTVLVVAVPHPDYIGANGEPMVSAAYADRPEGVELGRPEWADKFSRHVGIRHISNKEVQDGLHSIFWDTKLPPAGEAIDLEAFGESDESDKFGRLVASSAVTNADPSKDAEAKPFLNVQGRGEASAFVKPDTPAEQPPPLSGTSVETPIDTLPPSGFASGEQPGQVEITKEGMAVHHTTETVPAPGQQPTEAAPQAVTALSTGGETFAAETGPSSDVPADRPAMDIVDDRTEAEKSTDGSVPLSSTQQHDAAVESVKYDKTGDAGEDTEFK